MNSKEALKQYREIYIDKNYNVDSVPSQEWFLDIIKQDLNRLEKLEKVVDFLKLNFDISLDSKLRISDDSECVQTFITYLPENTTIDEMFKVLKEVIEND